MKNAPKTSVKIVKEKRHENLTLHDWMTVFAFIDEHPEMTQSSIVRHFASKPNALIFNQCTLSRKLKSWEELEKCITSHPNALSSKCPRVVTRPDVERAGYRAQLQCDHLLNSTQSSLHSYFTVS